MSEQRAEVADKAPYDYIKEVIVLLRRKNYKSAFRLAKDAYQQYPEDPVVLSYYGCLTAGVGRNYEGGIKSCKQALKALKRSDYDKSHFPEIYINLGRAYLAAGDKKHAFDSFHKGLAKDKGNKDLLWELKKLGRRRPPVLPFLKRSNLINRYLGKLRHWLLTR